MTKGISAKQTSHHKSYQGKKGAATKKTGVQRAIAHGKAAAVKAHAAISKARSKVAPKQISQRKQIPPVQHRGHKFAHHPPGHVTETVRPPPHELSEEFFVPSPIHRGKYRIPMGIRFLIGYLLFLTVLYIISFVSGITFPTSILFGKMITGARAMFINAVLLMIIMLILLGFYRRKAYAFDLSIGFFSFAALNAMISLILFESAEHPIFKQLLLLSFISLIIMNIVIVWYILHEKKYFYVEQFRDRPWHQRDKIFLYVLITFWAVALMIGVTLGAQFYKDTKRMIDDTVVELQGFYGAGYTVCTTKEGPDRDVCILVVATALSNQRSPAELKDMCGTIESDFYKFTCMRSIAG